MSYGVMSYGVMSYGVAKSACTRRNQEEVVNMAVVKVPKEIQDVFAEALAARELAEMHDKGWFPSPKALYYQHRAVKLELFAWRALKISDPDWKYNAVTGEATKEDPIVEKVKKPRKPRAKKEVAPAAAATTTGE